MAELHRASIRALCAGHYSAAQLAAWIAVLHADRYAALRATRTMLVAMRADEPSPLGFGVVTPRESLINAVYVSPTTVGRGVGRALVAALEDVARSAGCSAIRLNATLNAVPFYQRLGFCAVGPGVQALPSGDELACMQMTKALSSK